MYELFKQMKEVGFPQKEFGHGSIAVTLEGNLNYYDEHSATSLEEGNIIIPTLEEVIEACGEEFGKLELCGCMPAPHDHAAIWNARPRNEQIKGEHADKWTGRGDTPLEAVCRLWLELNKK